MKHKLVQTTSVDSNPHNVKYSATFDLHRELITTLKVMLKLKRLINASIWVWDYCPNYERERWIKHVPNN